jgi:AraC-like DNA-binding protein
MSRVLLDPAHLALLTRFQEFTAQGIRSYRQWGVRDGFDFGLPVPIHQHTVPTLVVCLAGQVRVEGATDLDLAPGDLLMIEPGCWHRHQPLKPGSMSFSMGFLAGRCDLMFGDHQTMLWGAVSEQPYRNLIGALVDEPTEAERLRLVDEVLSIVAHERIITVDWIDPGVHRMAVWLWRHLHERVDSGTIMARGGFSRATGFRLFKRFFGHSPKQELLLQRTALARHLLRRGFPMAECARRSGFISASEARRALDGAADERIRARNGRPAPTRRPAP